MPVELLQSSRARTALGGRAGRSIAVAPLLHRCCTAVAPLLHRAGRIEFPCSAGAKRCAAACMRTIHPPRIRSESAQSKRPAALLHRCCTAVAPLLHRCCTAVAPLLHRCCTAVAPSPSFYSLCPAGGPGAWGRQSEDARQQGPGE